MNIPFKDIKDMSYDELNIYIDKAVNSLQRYESGVLRPAKQEFLRDCRRELISRQMTIVKRLAEIKKHVQS